MSNLAAHARGVGDGEVTARFGSGKLHRCKVLIVDGNRDDVDLAAHHLRVVGYRVIEAETGTAAREVLRSEHRVSAVLLDPQVSGVSGYELLVEFAATVPVVVLTGLDEVDAAVRCIRLGAIDYVTKPFDVPRLTTSVGNACAQAHLLAQVARLSSTLGEREGIGRIQGESSAIEEVRRLLRRVAGRDATLLLLGESGTGKGQAARGVHFESPRRGHPFVSVNCGAIPASLIESELFGYARGAFTGATREKPGLFEQAEGGTIFLDEVAELQLDLQVKMLEVLQEQTVRRLGEARERELDVRVIAATNRDLKAEVDAGRFREDLYFRLAVFPVTLPPLRSRPEDIDLLAHGFLRECNERLGTNLAGFTQAALAALTRYDFPGNVRELENCVERAAILEDGALVTLSALPEVVVAAFKEGDAPARPVPADGESEEIVPLAEAERRIILHALRVTGGNVLEAARRLGISRATIYRKVGPQHTWDSSGAR